MAGSATSDHRRPDESEPAKLARNMAELLQELRVAQTGVQILFAFLLSVVFTARFGSATAFQRAAVIVTILLTTGSTVLLMAPAAWHRLYFRQGRRVDILRWGNRVALAGLALLAAAMTGVVLLVSDVVLGRAVAIVLACCVAALFAALWFVLPVTRRRATRTESEPEPEER
jgi:hypothetical protein